MQPFYVLLGLYANGISRIHDFRYPERIKYCDELSKFYPDIITASIGKIKIEGSPELSSNSVNTAESTDLRGSMAVVIAALLAEGDSVINNVEMALRGYNDLVEKLRKLGVNIEISNIKQ